MNDEQHQDIGELRPQYQTYDRQKCFIAYSEQAYWSADLLDACEQVLSKPEFNLELDYARKHFVSDVPLRQKAIELIANARYGIYDLSCWRADDKSPWQMPRNVFIELGIAIALNRPTLLLRHASNKEAGLELPNCLQCLGEQILEFSGKHSLKTVLLENFPKWVKAAPEQAWWNRHCIFGDRVCEHRETHPRSKQLGQNTLSCSIADGADNSRPDFREIVEDVLGRFSDVTYTYLDALSLEKGYSFLLCTHCQKVRLSPFAIHRITLKTPPEAFIAIGMSLALETQFEYKIPKILITEDIQNVPSLLSGYEVVVAKSDKDKKDSLRKFMPTVIKKVRETTWKPKPLPFIDISVNITNEDEIRETVNSETNDFNIERIVCVENLNSEVTEESIIALWSEYGKVVEVYLKTDSNTAKALVEMAEITEALASIEALDGAEWMGLEIKVRQATLEDISRINLNTEFKFERNTESNDFSSERIIYIGNLSTQSEEDIKLAFSEYGLVKQITLPIERQTGRLQGFALVEMETEVSENAAIEALHEAEWMGRTITVRKAKPEEIINIRVELGQSNLTNKTTSNLGNDKTSSSNMGWIRRGKTRIYELSKELNLDNKEILAICDHLNIVVKSHSSTISESDAERIRMAAEKLVAANALPRKPKILRNSNAPEASVAANTNQTSEKITAEKTQKPQLISPPTRPQAQTLATVYVGNLSYKVTEQDIKSVFAKYGNVRRVTLPTEISTGRLRGFAFVQMATESEANAAITELDGAEWIGRVLKVNKAKPR